MKPGLNWTGMFDRVHEDGSVTVMRVAWVLEQIPVGKRSTPSDPRRGFYLRGVPLWDAAVREVSTAEACRAGATRAIDHRATPQASAAQSTATQPACA